jgi:hypothetical protein
MSVINSSHSKMYKFAIVHFYGDEDFENHTISGNLDYLVQFAIHTIPGITLIEIVLTGKHLYSLFLVMSPSRAGSSQGSS